MPGQMPHQLRRRAELQTVPNGLDGYASIVAQAYFPMTLSRIDDGTEFESRTASERIGPALLTRICATGSYAARRETERGRRAASFVLNLTEAGGCVFHGSREAVTKPGDLILIDGSGPLEVVQSGTAQSLAIVIPACLLQRHCGRPADLVLRPLDSADGLPAILREALLGCWRQRASIDPVAALDLLGSLAQLVVGSFREVPAVRARGSVSERLHFLRIRDLVLQNLASSELCAEFVSDRLSMSKSYVFAIMRSADTTLGRLILEQRLERARQLLDHPDSAQRSISGIGYLVGFQQPAHFSRQFAARFGVPPRAYRERVMARTETDSIQ